MNRSGFRSKLLTIAIALTLILIGQSATAAVEKSPEQASEKVGIDGQYVRVATNDEGWVVLGYRLANESVGEEWMLLEAG